MSNRIPCNCDNVKVGGKPMPHYHESAFDGTIHLDRPANPQPDGTAPDVLQKAVQAAVNAGYYPANADCHNLLMEHISAAITAETERSKRELLERLKEYTHNGRGTILWEMDTMADAIDKELKQLGGSDAK